TMRTLPFSSIARAEAWRTLALFGFCAALAIIATPLRPGIVLGESMSPGFHSGQVFLMSQIHDYSCLRRGDVVLFDLGGQTYLKRIYAIGGDVVWAVVAPDEQDTSRWFVPDAELPEVQDLLTASPQLGTLARIRVPDDQIVVLGDAGSNSYDSRFFGSLPAQSVRGRVVLPYLFSLWSPDAADCGVAMAGERPAPARP
ncbi:MAG: signal peptidase I, partial [Armatimonadota bacterium]